MEKDSIEKLLETCAEEPIQFLGQIQNFSCLLGINYKNTIIEVCSANIAQLLNKKPEEVIGTSFYDHFENQFGKDFLDFNEADLFYNEMLIKLRLKDTSDDLDFYSYKTEKHIVLEYEFTNHKHKHNLQLKDLLDSTVGFNEEGISDTKINLLAQVLSDKIKKLTGFNRVMVYKFHPDEHGEVIAESRNDELEPYLGMHYPESDIPKQARELYRKNLVRIISDVESERVELITKNVNKESFDLSNSIARHVSPMHIEYLKNMGVCASMSISIVVEGKLWGLIACHHYSPYFLKFSDRTLLKFLGHSFASEVTKFKNSLLNQQLARVNMITVSMLQYLSRLKEKVQVNYLQKIFDLQATSILSLMNASSFYVEVGKSSCFLGKEPPKKVITYIKKSLKLEDGKSSYYNSCLKNLDASIVDSDNSFAGMLVSGVWEGDMPCFIVWFRPELKEEIRWAGKNDKELKLVNGVRRLSPRGSFEEVIALREGCSLGFNDTDLRVASEFFWFLYKVLMDQLQVAERSVKDYERKAINSELFISNLSHELRTPLNNILGWIQVYREKILNSGLEELYEVIENNSTHQLALINDLLDASRISNGKIKLNISKINPNDLIEDLRRYFAPSFSSKSISLSLSLSFDSLAMNGDEVRLNQILRNIIQNAIKFTPKKGEISIETKKIDSDLKIIIKDSGVGIEKENIQSLFREFYQVDNEKSRNNTGMGLGLALTKKLVELHGGSIWIQSEGVDLGTTVTLSFPISSTKKYDEQDNVKSLPTSDPNKSSSLIGVKALLIEDTVESARFIRIFLEQKGVDLTWASNAPDALNILNDEKFDLIISDIGLPGMDGHEFIEELKKRDLFDENKCIALSAYGTPQEIQKSIDVGFKRHLVKPIKLDLLISEIEGVLLEK